MVRVVVMAEMLRRRQRGGVRGKGLRVRLVGGAVMPKRRMLLLMHVLRHAVVRGRPRGATEGVPAKYLIVRSSNPANAEHQF